MKYHNIKTPEDHIEFITKKFSKRYREKYLAGQEEHGGRLWRKNTRKMLIEETLDFISYVDVIEEQLRDAELFLLAAIGTKDWDMVEEAKNILVYGNPEGIPEEDK